MTNVPVEPLATTPERVQVLATSMHIRDLSIERPSIIAYLQNIAPEALPPSRKLRRTAGVPNAAAALGWPAVALAEAGRRAAPKLGESHAERRRELAEHADKSLGISSPRPLRSLRST